MTLTGKHVYLLVQEPHGYAEQAVVEIYVDALEAITAARPRCDETRIRILTAGDDAAGVVFRGPTSNDTLVTVTRATIR